MKTGKEVVAKQIQDLLVRLELKLAPIALRARPPREMAKSTNNSRMFWTVFQVSMVAGLALFCSESSAQPWAVQDGETTEAYEQRRANMLSELLTSREIREESPQWRTYNDIRESQVRTRTGRRRGRGEDETVERFVATSETLRSPVIQRPQGPLLDKVLYIGAGHGWTNDNTSTGLWFTQRPALLGMVEDFGNQDQLTVLADAAFRGGATVVPMRPVGHQPVERVLDQLNEFQVRFHGEWADSTQPYGFRLPDTQGPGYRFARASLRETAVARYRPVIPHADWYPIYAFAVAGPDRVRQTYRIVTPGVSREVHVDHRIVGGGWVFLGEYFLPVGNVSYVEVTNLVDDPAVADGNHYVVADAIRFGNGRGDFNRGYGISGRLREDEASVYWVGRTLPPQDMGVAWWVENDHDANISVPARMAAYMNRETSATVGTAVYLGFHSNARPETAAPQRGALSLLTRTTESRTLLQEEWAGVLVDSTNALLSEARGLPVPWVVHPSRFVSFINYGEIRRDSHNNEMPATILEVAFHDNAEDVELLQNLPFRRMVADACVSATVAFLREVRGEAALEPDSLLPPSRPYLAGVSQVNTTSTLVDLAYWMPAGGGAKDHVVVEVGPLQGAYRRLGQLPNPPRIDLGTTQPTKLRLIAIGPGGESLPSRELAVSGQGTTLPRALIISGFEAEDRSLEIHALDPGPFNFPTGTSGTFTRISPRWINPHDQVIRVIGSFSPNQFAWDSVTALAFYEIKPGDERDYKMMVYLEGRQGPPHPGIQPQALAQLKSWGAKVPILISGSAVLRPRSVDDQSRNDLAQWFGVRFGGTTSQTARLIPEQKSRVDDGFVTVTNQLPAGYLPQELDWVLGEESESGAIWRVHDDDENGVAGWIVQEGERPVRGLLLAPLENLAPAQERRRLINEFLQLAFPGTVSPVQDDGETSVE